MPLYGEICRPPTSLVFSLLPLMVKVVEEREKNWTDEIFLRK